MSCKYVDVDVDDLQKHGKWKCICAHEMEVKILANAASDASD